MKKLLKKSCSITSGITLIALVITIIILLILAGISIAILSGENGILTKSTQTVNEYKKESAREKIKLAITIYEMDKEHTTLYKELLKIEGLSSITPNDENEEFQYNVVVDGYEFIVQKNEETGQLEVIYIGEAGKKKYSPELQVDYDKEKTEILNITITATTKDEEGLKKIIVSHKHIEEETITYEDIKVEDITQAEKEKTINVQIPSNGEYIIQVVGQNGQITKQEITITNIVNATILATINAGEVIDNHVVITVRGQNTEIPIKMMELYVDGKKVATYEYEDAQMEKQETYTINNMEFYKDIPCYVKVINTQGRDESSIIINPKNTTTIATVTDLRNLAIQVNNKGNNFLGRTVKLINDIAIGGTNGNQWVPIGNSSNNFKGNFVGNKHTIYGIYINNTNDFQGLFGYMQNATITDLIITGSNITGNSCVGGIVGKCLNTKILNCAIFNSVNINGNTNVGGLAGISSSNSMIEACYNARKY